MRLTAVTNHVASKSSGVAVGSMGPPPRPPRRIQVDAISESMSPPPTSAHTASHSLSSMHMFSPPNQRIPLEDQAVSSGAAVSRTQSLRNQAKHSQSISLGRSSSLRDSSEVRQMVWVELTIDTCTNTPALALAPFHGIQSAFTDSSTCIIYRCFPPVPAWRDDW
jgi:hypothetical protein